MKVNSNKEGDIIASFSTIMKKPNLNYKLINLF